MTSEESLEKLKAMIHLESLDMVKLLGRYDTKLSGTVTQQSFLNVMRASGLTDKEAYDVIQSASRTGVGDIYYRELALKLEKEPLKRSRVRLQEASNIEALRVKAANLLAREYLPPGQIDQVTFDNMLRRGGMPEDERISVWASLVKPITSTELAPWIQRYSSKYFMTPQEMQGLSTHPVRFPEVLVRLRADVRSIGLLNVAGIFYTQPSFTQEQMREILLKLRLVKSPDEFSRFMEWCINERIVTSVRSELVVICERLLDCVKDCDISEETASTGERSRLDTALDRIYREVLGDKLSQFRKAVEVCSVDQYVDEYNLRHVIAGVFPVLQANEVSLLLSSIPHVLPPEISEPHRRFYVLDVYDLIAQAQIPRGPLKLPPEAFVAKSPAEDVKDAEVPPAPLPISQVCLERRDWQWEAAIIKKLGGVDLSALLRNFSNIEVEGTGQLSLERFHWVLVKSLPFMSQDEIFFIVHFAVQLHGKPNSMRTQAAQAQLGDFLAASHTISARLFPDGTQYDISYGIFLLEIEKLASKIL